MRVSAALSDVVVTTFVADRSRLRDLLPPGVDDDLGLVSAVSFVLGGVNFAPGLRCGHVDYRAYVSCGGETCVWFLGAAMDNVLAHVLRLVWRMPWHRSLGTLEVRATPAAVAHDEESRRLVEPVVGLFADGRGGVRRYTVAHGPLSVRHGVVEVARVELFERIGLVAPGAPPHSVLLVDDFRIEIDLPPKRVIDFAPVVPPPVY